MTIGGPAATVRVNVATASYAGEGAILKGVLNDGKEPNPSWRFCWWWRQVLEKLPRFSFSSGSRSGCHFFFEAAIGHPSSVIRVEPCCARAGRARRAFRRGPSALPRGAAVAGCESPSARFARANRSTSRRRRHPASRVPEQWWPRACVRWGGERLTRPELVPIAYTTISCGILPTCRCKRFRCPWTKTS